jgi:hypothetical protein
MQNGQTKHEKFVTIVAWICIVSSGCMMVMSAIQNLMFHVFLPFDELVASFDVAVKEWPFVARFILEYLQWFIAAYLLVAVASFIASVGLLKRKNWARLTFITLLVLGTAWMIAVLGFQQFFMADMAKEIPADGSEVFAMMRVVMSVFSIVMGLGYAALSGWLVWKFCTPPIVAQFVRAVPGQAT